MINRINHKPYLQVSTDLEHRFELALQIGNLEVAVELARESDSPQKWAQLAEVASSKNKFDLVQECLEKANDFGGLLLLATSSGNEHLLKKLGDNSATSGKHNISFLSMFLLGDLDRCLEILIETNRIPEAAFFARTYMPSKINYVVDLWRQELGKLNEKAGQSLADPTQYENLFPGFQEALKVEQFLNKTERHLTKACESVKVPLNQERDATEEMRVAEQQSGFQYDPKEKAPQVESQQKPQNWCGTKPPKLEETEDFQRGDLKLDADSPSPEQDKRRSSLDEFDLEMEGLNLDENVDTSVSLGIKKIFEWKIYKIVFTGC